MTTGFIFITANTKCFAVIAKSWKNYAMVLSEQAVFAILKIE